MTNYGEQFSAAIAAELRAEKARTALTLPELMEKTGLSDSSIRRYLKGDRTIPMDAFMDICKALEVDPHHIFTRAQQVTQ